MNNQATEHIKTFLTENDCKLQLVEPHNHCVNATERRIQTFKDAFIATLATTDHYFPPQLWDWCVLIKDTLNLLRASCIDPSKLAYEILNRPYNWNRYPLALLGCKAVVYKGGDTCKSGASRGVGAWYLGPSQDHYQCDSYYIIKTRAYQISASKEPFPQHHQFPGMTPHQHLKALTDELADATAGASGTPQA